MALLSSMRLGLKAMICDADLMMASDSVPSVSALVLHDALSKALFFARVVEAQVDPEDMAESVRVPTAVLDDFCGEGD